MKPNVISLFQYKNKESEDHNFVIFQAEDDDLVFSLSPDVMKVNDHLYIGNLYCLRGYLRRLSEKKTTTVFRILEHILINDVKSNLAVLCDHPFQGVLLMEHFSQRGLEGVFAAKSPFVSKSYQNINFEAWVSAGLTLYKSFDQYGILKKERNKFLSQLEKFRIFKSRLNISKFSELDKVSFESIQKRYKRFFGLLWKWTYPSLVNEHLQKNDLFSQGFYALLDDFPWQPLEPKKEFLVENYLEYPISYWESVKDFLEKDIVKVIHSLGPLRSSRVLCFKWTVILYDMSEVCIDVPFKHPVSMAQEDDVLLVKLLPQFHFAFENFKELLQDKKKDLDFVDTQLIVGWQVKISQRIGPSLTSLELLIGDGLSDFESGLQNLNNKLKGSLSYLQSRSCHVYGHDSQEKSLESEKEKYWQVSSVKPLSSQSLKPLFIFPKFVLIEESTIKFKRFLERSSSNWWEGSDYKDTYRDYFICESFSGELIWAFCDYKNRWFKHGLFS